METGETKPLYYKRVIWLKDKEKPREASEVFINLLKDNTYIFKQFDVVLHVKELVDFRHTKNAYEYFEELRTIEDSLKTLCIINHEEDSYIARDIMLSKVTKLWTSFKTAYINYNKETTSLVKSFNYIIKSENLVDRLTCVIQSGR